MNKQLGKKLSNCVRFLLYRIDVYFLKIRENSLHEKERLHKFINKNIVCIIKMSEKKLRTALDTYIPLKIETASSDLPLLMEKAKSKENVCEEECKLLYQTALSQYIIQRYKETEDVGADFTKFLADEYDIHVDKFPDNLEEILRDEVFPLLKRFIDENIKKEEVDVNTLADIALEKMEGIDEGLTAIKRKFKAYQRV